MLTMLFLIKKVIKCVILGFDVHFFVCSLGFYYLCAILCILKNNLMLDMRQLLTNFLMAVAMVVMLSACSTSRNKIVYIQGAEEIGTFQNQNPYALSIQPDDKLTIIVSCKEPELAAPFNMMLNQRSFTTQGNVTFSQNGGTPQIFWVDMEGNIQYPTIGKLNVKGMNRYDLQEYLQNYLQSNGYIQDPIVTVDFYNAKYSVLGEVTNPGQFTMTSDRVTLFDAIALARDLTIYGERDKVRVVRQEDGKQTVVTLDLKDPKVIESPYFYIHHNDVIYVEPNKTKASNREVSTLYSFGISIVSLLATLTTLTINIINK